MLKGWSALRIAALVGAVILGGVASLFGDSVGFLAPVAGFLGGVAFPTPGMKTAKR